MEMMFDRCCGMDVHAKTVVACLRTPGERGKRHSEVRTFGTTTAQLLALSAWLTEAGCTHVAMESTGVYWKPVHNLLEGSQEILLVNPRHMKAVPGRKTDVKDCEWIAQLLEHGLLRASFIPPQPIRELRELTRYRKTLIQERARQANRLHKVLESANIKLGNVASEVMGVSGRLMVKALIAGERDAGMLAELAKGRLRHKRAELGAALTGRFTDHHGFLLQEILAHVEFLDGAISDCDQRIQVHTRPFTATLDQLVTIPGVARRGAECILAEVGADMKQFASAKHLASWACICPGNNESAGKRRSGRMGGQRLAARDSRRVCLGGRSDQGHVPLLRSTRALRGAGAARKRSSRWRTVSCPPSVRLRRVRPPPPSRATNRELLLHHY